MSRRLASRTPCAKKHRAFRPAAWLGWPVVRKVLLTASFVSLLAGLPLAAGAEAKTYTVVLTGSAQESVAAVSTGSGAANEDPNGFDCDVTTTTMSTASFSAHLAKPGRVFPTGFPLFFKALLLGPKAGVTAKTTGVGMPKRPGVSCTFSPTTSNVDCPATGAGTGSEGLQFVAQPNKAGRFVLLQENGGGGPFGYDCPADVLAGGGSSGGFLNPTGIVTTLKLSAVKKLKVGQKASAKGGSSTRLTESLSGLQRTIVATAGYKITVTRKS